MEFFRACFVNEYSFEIGEFFFEFSISLSMAFLLFLLINISRSQEKISVTFFMFYRKTIFKLNISSIDFTFFLFVLFWY